MDLTLEQIINILNKSAFILLPIVVASLLIAIWRGKQDRDPIDSLTNMSIYAVGRLIKFTVSRSFELAILSLFYKLSPFHIPFSLWSFGLLIFATDFIYYWMHRWEHEIPALWIWHSVHHSSTDFNTSTALRLSWAGQFLNWIFWIPLVLLGFSPLAVVTAYQVVLLFQFPLHTQKIGPLPWFDKIFNTPMNHRVHHGANEEYLDKNYGGILIIWDRIFGTYASQQEPVRYGLVENIQGKNPVYVNFAYFMKMVEKIKIEPTLRGKFLLLWRWPVVQKATSSERENKRITKPLPI